MFGGAKPAGTSRLAEMLWMKTESNPNSSSASSNAGPLVQVTFQKDPNRKKKYLESEPKALGCTQIVLAFFLVNAGLLNGSLWWSTVEIINGIFPIIAGSVAIAAQNLSLRTFRACLGLQVFTSIICGVTLLCMLGMLEDMHHHDPCRYWTYDEVNGTVYEACTMLLQVEDHYSAGTKVVLATILGISITLAAYCCKVIQCCSPAGFMPVITVNAPPAPEVRREDREGESPSDG
ncbi:uncharacterized protein LOC125311685 isoform X1 [Alosa alosa]|uniref:uncharacterized protein LOC125311685 isoform X1 n=1 Tax=Alosa alosa TaxID=278164 RepID=UPI002015352D|nr:uncharacterized protein LOC125311685 isoform X1 [Alosa alosa]